VEKEEVKKLSCFVPPEYVCRNVSWISATELKDLFQSDLLIFFLCNFQVFAELIQFTSPINNITAQ